MKRTLMIKAFVPSALGTMPLQVLAAEHTIITGTEFATVLAATTHTAGDTFVVANDITLNTNKGNTSWRTAQATLTGANTAAATQSADINGVVTTFTSTETSQTDNGIDSAGLLTSIDNLVAAGNSNHTTVTVGTQNGIVVVAGQADTTMENLRYTGGAFTVYNNESGRVLGVANTATAIQNNSIDNNTVQVNGGLYAGSRYVSRGQISGHSIGLYGTIYDQAKDESGYYLDAWITGNNFKSSVSGQDIAETNYNLSGVVASVELGLDTPLRIRPDAEYNPWVTYQLQVTYQGVDSGNLVEANGTKIGDNAHNVQTRLGARFYRKNVESYNGSTRPVNQPYAELNWYYNFNDYEMSFDGESLAIDGAKNIFELKVGYEKQVGNSVQLWGNVFGGWGSNGYKSYGFTAGAKYSF